MNIFKAAVKAVREGLRTLFTEESGAKQEQRKDDWGLIDVRMGTENHPVYVLGPGVTEADLSPYARELYARFGVGKKEE